MAPCYMLAVVLSRNALKAFRQCLVLCCQCAAVLPNQLTIGNGPLAIDHDITGTMGVTQYQGSQRVSRSGEAQLIHLEQGQVSAFARLYGANIGPSEAASGSGSTQGQGIQMAEFRGTVLKPV